MSEALSAFTQRLIQGAENPERQDVIWQFFRALLDGRVVFREERLGGYRVTVTPPVQAPDPKLMATVDDQPTLPL